MHGYGVTDEHSVFKASRRAAAVMAWAEDDWAAPQNWRLNLMSYHDFREHQGHLGEALRAMEVENQRRLYSDGRYLRLRSEIMQLDHQCQYIVDQMREAFGSDKIQPRTDPHTYNRIIRLLRADQNIGELQMQVAGAEEEYRRVLDSFAYPGHDTPEPPIVLTPRKRGRVMI